MLQVGVRKRPLSPRDNRPLFAIHVGRTLPKACAVRRPVSARQRVFTTTCILFRDLHQTEYNRVFVCHALIEDWKSFVVRCWFPDPIMQYTTGRHRDPVMKPQPVHPCIGQTWSKQRRGLYLLTSKSCLPYTLTAVIYRKAVLALSLCLSLTALGKWIPLVPSPLNLSLA